MKNLFTVIILCSVFISCSDDDLVKEKFEMIIAGAGHVSPDFSSTAFISSWNDSINTRVGPRGVITSGFVEGTDVYHAGRAAIDTLDVKPAFWKNGVRTILADSGNVTAIFALNGDVFTAGYIIEDKIKIPVYWKNTTVTPLDTIGTVTTFDIVADGNDVYVLGMDDDHTGSRPSQIWKNGVKQLVLTDGNLPLEATTMLMSGFDVYAAGSDRLWKNGTVSSIALSTGATSCKINLIFVHDADVYLAGSQTGESTTYATYWKNGVPVVLSGSAMNAASIKVEGSDVFIIGHKANEFNTYNLPVYWKNDKMTSMQIPDGHIYRLFDFSLHEKE